MEYPAQMGIDPGLVALLKNDNGGGFGGGDNPFAWIVGLAVVRQFLHDPAAVAAAGGAGVRDVVRLSDLLAATNAINENFTDIQRDISTAQARGETNASATQVALKDLGMQVCLGQKDIEKAICECCCKLGIGQAEIKNAIDKCCCETQNAIALQTNTLERAICNEGRETRDLITSNRILELTEEKNALSAEVSGLKQTQDIVTKVVMHLNSGGGGHGGGRGGK